MSRIPRPTGSTAIALLALFVAIGGTGYAAATINGKDIRNKSIAGKKLRNGAVTGKQVKRNSITGRQVRESSLSTVPKAQSAASADGLSGPAAAAYVSSDKVSTGSLVKLVRTGDSPATTPRTTLLAKEPFTVTGACYDDAGKPHWILRVESSEPGSVLDSELVNPLEYDGTSAAFDAGIIFITALAPSGKTLGFSVDFVVNGLGADCAFAVNAVTNR